MVGCAQCWSESAEIAYRAVTRTDIEHYLIDDSHYIVSLRRCAACAQHYLQVTTETVDWLDGDDPVHRVFTPLTLAECDGLRAMGTPSPAVLQALAGTKDSLHFDWPKGQDPSTFWRGG